MQSMLLLFLPRPSLLFEIYPYKYFKQAYSPLSREYGVLHGNVMSPPFSRLNALILHGNFVACFDCIFFECIAINLGVSTKTCMEYKYCRVFSRADNVLMTAHGHEQLLGRDCHGCGICG